MKLKFIKIIDLTEEEKGGLAYLITLLKIYLEQKSFEKNPSHDYSNIYMIMRINNEGQDYVSNTIQLSNSVLQTNFTNDISKALNYFNKPFESEEKLIDILENFCDFIRNDEDDSEFFVILKFDGKNLYAYDGKEKTIIEKVKDFFNAGKRN